MSDTFLLCFGLSQLAGMGIGACQQIGCTETPRRAANWVAYSWPFTMSHDFGQEITIWTRWRKTEANAIGVTTFLLDGKIFIFYRAVISENDTFLKIC